MTAFNATALLLPFYPQSAMPMVQLNLHKKNELLCLLIRSSVRHHNQVHVLDLGSYLLGHLLDTSKAQRLVACMHAWGDA